MNFSEKNINNTRHMLITVLCVFTSMLICAGCTSPLYPHYTCLDSSMFLLTGRGILEGKICYADLFDHKGPVFFWLEAIGYSLGGRTGVWVFQCIVATIDIIIVENICRELKAKPLLPVIAAASVFFYTFSHGDITEEFSMPLILAALLIEVKFLASKDEIHNPWNAFVYGIIIGLLAFIRINNAVSICTLIVCIGVVLLKGKQWKNILFNFLAGIAGVAVVTVPICLYYYTHGILGDMLYATFLHNLIYAKNNTHEMIISSRFLYFALMYAPGIFATTVFALKTKTGSKRLYGSLTATAVVTYLMLVYSNVYEHYFMLGIPVFAISVACTFQDFDVGSIKSQFSQKRVASLVLMVIVFAFSLLSVYSAGAPFYKTYISKTANEQCFQIRESMKVVPEEERNSVIGYGILADFYIHADITPCYKYYTLQRWMTTEKRDVRGEFINYVSNEHPLWIVTKKNEKDKEMLSALDDYLLVISDSDYNYYRYKE